MIVAPSVAAIIHACYIVISPTTNFSCGVVRDNDVIMDIIISSKIGTMSGPRTPNSLPRSFLLDHGNTISPPVISILLPYTSALLEFCSRI